MRPKKLSEIIPDPDFFFSSRITIRIPDSGVKKNTESRIRNTVL